jgi:hypothetical protein
VRRLGAAIAALALLAWPGPSNATPGLQSGANQANGEHTYDGFFALSFDASQRNHEATTSDAAFTQRAYRVSGRFDYFGLDQPSALGSIPGIEGIFNLGWAGTAAYSAMNASANTPPPDTGGGLLLDFDVVANWTLVRAERIIWQVGPRLTMDFDLGLRDVETLTMGAGASTRIFYRVSSSTWGRLELDHQLADFTYDRHEQARAMVALGNIGFIAMAGYGKTMGSGFTDIGISVAWVP